MHVYFDNAATSFPKPRCVIDAMVHYQETCGASPGRGAYVQAKDATKVLDRCRALLCTLVHANDHHCIFTLNCTDALNLAINGIASHHTNKQEAVHIVTTAMDHNSVFRPLHALEAVGVTHTIVNASPETGLVDPSAIADAITSNTRLVAVAHGSNVTGTVQDIAAIGDVCGDIPFLVDAAQTMGHTPIDLPAMGVDLLAFPGHKGLLGPLGTGGLLMHRAMVKLLQPIRWGGTGSQSELPIQPTATPDKYESGSHNMIGIYGLAASVNWILEQSVAKLHSHEMELCSRFIESMRELSGVRIIGPQTTKDRCGVFSLVFEGMQPHFAASHLEESAGIRSRAGLHCAPFAHRTMGTSQSGGTVRVSLGSFHTHECVDHLVEAIAQCTQLALA